MGRDDADLRDRVEVEKYIAIFHRPADSSNPLDTFKAPNLATYETQLRAMNMSASSMGEKIRRLCIAVQHLRSPLVSDGENDSFNDKDRSIKEE